MSVRATLELIRQELDGTEWSSETCARIAEHLRSAGEMVRDPAEVVDIDAHLVFGQCRYCWGINRHEHSCTRRQSDCEHRRRPMSFCSICDAERLAAVEKIRDAGAR